MNCPSCAHANRPGAKFCEECAAPLKRACASCGCELRPSAKFCDECGTPAMGAATTQRRTDPAGARKVVSIVFADLVGSTALHERIDPESARRFMESYYDAMRGAVESHGGTVTQLLGDGVKAVFGIPRVAEDDAIRAVRAAVAMQESFRALAEQQRGAVGQTGLRVAVNTGEVVANDATEIIGDPVNVAARLQEQGRDGDVVIGDSTARLVAALVTLAPLGSFTLKGRAEPVAAFRVESLEPPESAALAAFVGRDAEIARVTAVYDTAVEKPATCLAVLLGSPGLGKSRLIDEFASRLGEAATVAVAQCDAAGGATFAPLAEALRERLGIDAGANADAIRAAIEAALPGDDERARIAGGVAALLAGSPAPPEETFFVVRRLLAALAMAKPVVLVIDDIHWAEPLLLDLVEHLVQWGSGVPLLVLCGARPELRDMRSSLVTTGGLVSDVVTLAGLDAGAAMRLAANVIGAADLPAAVAAKVLAASEGNPLFVGELVRMLVHEGALTREGDRWTTGTALAALEMPPTIHALLAARIERLRPEERSVLERAAVVGRQFSRSAVAELLPLDVADLDARLESLRRSELIERDTGWFLGEPVLRFHHVLIRDAAYRGLLKGTRAELHERFSNWATAKAGDAIEHDETIGWHLEQAHQLLRELGPIDAKGRALGERASRHLADAGRRALARDDLPLAASLLGRALERLDADDPARADLALDWCEALLAAGDVGPAAAAIDELARFSAASDRLLAWHTCFAGQHTVLTAPSALRATADAVAAAAESLAALGDAAGEAKGHFVHALALSRLGEVGACEAALDRALAAARRAGDRRRANTVLAIAPLAALWGPSPVTRASGRCLDVVRVLRITQGAPAVEAVAISCQGVLEALRGRTDAARRMIASARRMVEELGITQRLLEADVFGGLVELLEGDAPAAERSLRGAYAGLRKLGLGIDAARAAALLARALLAQDRVAEAETLSHESEALAGDDLKAAIAWRGVRAEALARRGEHAAAVEFASKAVELAAATDALLDHADARLALAAALRAAGRGREADAEERRTAELWEAKGATLLAERTAPAAVPVAPSVAAAAPRAAHVPRRRPVRPNFAFEEMRRVEAAVAARDIRAVEALYRRDVEIVDHQFGITYGHAAIVERVRAHIEESTDSAFAHEPLASLGDSLALCRMRSTASGSTAHGIPVGATEGTYLILIEADEQGSARHIEIFGDDKLGDAVVRLYERYAEQLPEGAERRRAAAAARSVAAWSGPPDLERMEDSVASSFECADHRPFHTWSSRGRDEWLQHWRTWLSDVTTDERLRDDDLLALEPTALLVRRAYLGTDRRDGGAYENLLLVLLAFDADGLLARVEGFEPDREAEALARFDALTAEPATPRSSRRVRPNSATRTGTLFAAAVASHDIDALARILSAQLEVVHHPTGSTYGSTELLEIFRSLFEADSVDHRWELMAGLGERLSLARSLFTVDGVHGVDFAIGLAEVEIIHLFEVDEVGLLSRSEVFAADRLGDAVAHCYERYAEQLPAGAARARAEATARSVPVVAPGGFDRDRYAAAFRPDVEIVDHRLLGLGGGVGLETLFRSMTAAGDVADQVVSHPQDVLALTHDALLLRWLAAGVGRESGGAFEWAFLRLFVFDADGRVARYELFDANREAEALARFEALVSGGHTTEPQGAFANAASRADRRLFELFDARDWTGIEALAAPGLVFDERRRLVRNTCGREVWLEQFRVLFDVPASRFATKLLATRGQLLSLNLHCFSGEVADGGDPLAMDDHFALHQVDREGRIVAIVLFDQDDEAEAHAELDARWQARQGAEHSVQLAFLRSFDAALARRDWDAVAANYAPAFVGTDHRLVGWGTLQGPAAFVEAFRTLVALAPDVRLRWDHLRTSSRGLLANAVWLGTRDGGAFDNPFLLVAESGADGRLLRSDFYDVHHLDRAHARFAEIESAAPPYASRFANAATRATDETVATWMAADWERFASLFPADARLSDRRRAVQLELGREELIAFSRSLGEHATTRVIHVETLATRGERLALQQWRVELAGDGVGPSEISHLSLMEMGEQGIRKGLVRWDDDAIDAAWAELDARFEAGEGAAHPHVLASHIATNAAIQNRDWDALAARCDPAFRMCDHRLLGWGTMVNDAAMFVRVVRSAVELAPDSNYRHDHLRICARGTLAGMVLCGTRDGGAFETPLLRVTEVDEQGRILSHDTYDESDYERALARFAELAAPEAPDRRFENAAAIAKPNAANAAMDRWEESYGVAFETGDWEPMRALCAPDLVFDDRRRLALLSGDRDFMIAAARERVAMDARPQRSLRDTAGDRVAIETILWSGGPPDGRFEIEYQGVVEVDESGLLAAMVMVDSDDTRAAQREAWSRWSAIDPAVAPWAELLNEIGDAWNGRDRAGLRARFADDVVVEDQRHTGIGRIEGAPAYVEANVVLWDLAPDQRIEFDSSWLAFDRYGLVATLRRFGTLADGGAFESEYVWLSLARDGRITHLELFEVEQQAAALARFEELRPDPLRIPPNAAARAVRRIAPLYANADLPALRAIVSDDFVFDDRTRGSLLRGGVEEWVSGLRFLRTETRARLDTRLVATAGDWLALNRLSWQETPGESSFLIERFGLYEIDATGKLRAFVLFDADDRAAADDELFERYVALGGEGMPACLVEFKRAIDARDLDRLRAVLADDFVYDDRRRTGSGRLDGPDAYLASPRAWWDLSEDARIDTLYSVAVAPHGRVGLSRMAGRNLEGGHFESFMITVLWTPGERIAGAELFEIDQLDAALARLEELRPDPLRIPLTAATRMRDRIRDAFVARDWDAIRALTGAGFVFDDRGKRALVRGDIEAWIASLEFTSQPGFRIESAIIGTLGDRILLDQLRWSGKPDGDAFEFERVRLLDVGADGLLRAVVFFDPEDRFAASVEGLARFAADEAAGS